MAQLIGKVSLAVGAISYGGQFNIMGGSRPRRVPRPRHLRRWSARRAASTRRAAVSRAQTGAGLLIRFMCSDSRFGLPTVSHRRGELILVTVFYKTQRSEMAEAQRALIVQREGEANQGHAIDVYGRRISNE
jgi:hypothetical protein